jgi:hypothetical protein
MLFQLRKGDVVRIEPDDRQVREEKIQSLIEGHLKEFLDLEFVCRWPHIDGKEIDTLAFLPAMRVPVIVEYKRGIDRQVVDQITGYWAKVKAEKWTVMEALRKVGITGDDAPIDFDSPQVVIVAKDFTFGQTSAREAGLKFLRLFRYQLYADNIVSLEEVSPEEGGRVRGTTPSRHDLDHFGMRPETRELYDELDKGITELDSRVKPANINKGFIGYGATGRYFCTVKPIAKELNLYVKYSTSRPARAARLKLKKLPPDRWRPMTHTFKISHKGQLKPALQIISGAFRDSI